MHTRQRAGRTSTVLLLALLACGLGAYLVLRSTNDHAPSSAQTHAREPQGAPDDAPAPEAPAPLSEPRSTDSDRAAVPPTIPEATEPSTATESGGLEVLVSWEDGIPLSAIDVLLTSEEQVLDSSPTDAEGRVTFMNVPASGVTVRVRDGDFELWREALSTPEGALHIEIPIEESLSGTVRVAGHEPGEKVLLSVKTNAGRVGLGHAQAVWMGGLSFGGSGENSTWTATDEDGRFSFRGLSPDWRGELRPLGGFRFASGGEVLLVDGPTSGLVLDLVAPAYVRGRVLSATGKPVADLSFGFDQRSPGMTMRRNAKTDSNGRFRIALMGSDFEKVVLYLEAPGAGQRVVEKELDPGSGADLGDIVLEAVRSVRFLVTDLDGTPLEGASVRWETQNGTQAGPDGITRIDTLAVDPVTVEVSAPLHLPAMVELGPWTGEDGDDDPVPVSLEPATCLDVRLVDSTGEPAQGMKLRLAAEPLFVSRVGGGFPDQPRAYGSFMTQTTSRKNIGTIAALVQLGGEGRALVSGLSPGIPIQLTALDSTEAEVGWSETVVLEAGRTRTIEAVVGEGLAMLRIEVLSPDGKPVPGARIELNGYGRTGIETATDGTFELGPLRVESSPLLIRGPGYAPFYVPDATPGVPVRVQLERGREHSLRILAPDGEPAKPERVFAQIDSTILESGAEVEPGLYHFSNLPSGPVEFVAQFDKRDHTAMASPGTETVIEIPTPGRLVVYWDPYLEPGERCGFSIALEDDEFSVRGMEFGPEELDAGACSLDDLDPGIWILRCFITDASGMEGEEIDTQTIEILPGETTTVEVAQ